MKISIIVLIYNERDNIKQVHDEIMSTIEKNRLDAEIIYVDDGSVDGSFQELKNVSSSDSRVKVISFRRNFGQTAAFSAGVAYATGELIIPMDGDGQNDPAEIPKLIKKIEEGYDLVSGWRRLRRDNAFSRTLPSIIANYIISRISSVHLHDFGCTLKAYRADVIKGVHLYGEMHRFIPIYATWEGAKVTEIVVNHRERLAGKSKYGIGRTFKVIFDLMVVKYLEKYFSKPIHLFGGFAVISLFCSLATFLLMIYFKFWGGKDFIQTPLPVLVVTFGLVGVLCFIIGLLAEMVTRTYFESQHRMPYQVKRLINLTDSELNSRGSIAEE